MLSGQPLPPRFDSTAFHVARGVPQAHQAAQGKAHNSVGDDWIDEIPDEEETVDRLLLEESGFKRIQQIKETRIWYANWRKHLHMGFSDCKFYLPVNHKICVSGLLLSWKWTHVLGEKFSWPDSNRVHKRISLKRGCTTPLHGGF